MALTEAEVKVLGALAIAGGAGARTVRDLSRDTELPETSIRRALLRLVRSGLAVATLQSPARWLSTSRGRIAIRRPGYREYAGATPANRAAG